MNPTFLYKHMGLSKNTFYRTIPNNSVHFHTPSSLSEPFAYQIKDITEWNSKLLDEFLGSVDEFFGENVFKPTRQNKNLTNKEYKDTAQAIIDAVKTKIGISSFITDPYNVRCWSRYTGYQHKGVCLEFDITNDPIFHNLVQANYSSVFPEFDYKKNGNKFFEMLLGSKAIDFFDESEYVLFYRKSGSVRFQKDSLKSIIFGYRVTEEDINKIYYTLKHLDYTNVVLKQVVLSNQDYGVSFKEV